MLANNETGVVQPLQTVAERVRENGAAARSSPMQCKATSFMNLADSTSGADLVALSAHKLGGPVSGQRPSRKLRAPAEVAPHQHGGGQERERRSGTQNVAGAVGLATALRSAAAGRAGAVAQISALRDPVGRRPRRGVSPRRTARFRPG